MQSLETFQTEEIVVICHLLVHHHAFDHVVRYLRERVNYLHLYLLSIHPYFAKGMPKGIPFFSPGRDTAPGLLFCH